MPSKAQTVFEKSCSWKDIILWLLSSAPLPPPKKNNQQQKTEAKKPSKQLKQIKQNKQLPLNNADYDTAITEHATKNVINVDFGVLD